MDTSSAAGLQPVARGGRALGHALAWIVGSVLRVRRAHVEASMRRAGVRSVARAAAGMYRSLGVGLVELVGVAFGRMPQVRLPAARIESWMGAGGAVIATAHTGNWDAVACALAGTAPLTVVTKRLSVRWLDALWQSTRARRGVRLVGEGRAARAALAALGRGELVAMLIDQAPERPRAVEATTFLGAPAWVDLSPALVAMRARVPLVVAFCRRDGRGGHAVEVVRVVEPPARPSRAWARRVMLEATGDLEAFVRRHPIEWLWMHRRWKPLPPAGGGASGRGR